MTLSVEVCGKQKDAIVFEQKDLWEEQKKGKVRNEAIRQIKPQKRARKKEDTVVGTLQRVSDDRGPGVLPIPVDKTAQGKGDDHEPAKR